MKKFDWKKVLILVFALVLVFSLAACGPKDTKKKDGNKVTAEDFLNKLMDGVGGYINSLGATDGVRHIDAKLVVKVGSEGREAGKDANYEIRIAGNFDDTTTDYAKNDALIEVKDLNDSDKEKVILALYANSGKVYIKESLTTADKAEQKLKIEDITAFQYQQYLAQIPALMEGLLDGFDLQESFGGLITNVAAPMLEDLLKITKEGNTYKAKLLIGELDSIFSLLEDIDLQAYREIINLILPSVLGVTLGTDNSLSTGASSPEIYLNVVMNDAGQFNGLTFDYSWPKKDGNGNDVKVNVGLTDITINNTSKGVTEGMDFKDYKDGALKVEANVNVPGLSQQGFVFDADFYVKPGFATIDGTADSENQVLKVELVAKKDGAAYPLAAEYKYETDEATGKRIGRLYFDMGALTQLAGMTDTQTKYYVNFDIAEFLIGAATPTQEEFQVTGLPDGLNGKVFFKTYKNRNYYIKNEEFADGTLWAGSEIRNSSGVVGTVKTWGRFDTDGDKKEDTSFIDVLLTVGSEEKIYRIFVSDADMLAKMKGSTVTATATEYTARDESSAANTLVYDANNQKLDVTEARNDGYYYSFKVFNGATEVGKKYYFYMDTAIGSDETTVLSEDIGARLQKIFEIIQQDLQQFTTPGNEAEVYGIWLTKKGTIYSVNSIDEMITNAGGNTLKLFNNKTGKVKGEGLFTYENSNNFVFNASLTLMQKPSQTSEQVYAELVQTGELEKYLEAGLVRVQNGTAEVPAITSDIQVNNGTDFEFDINGVGGLIQKLLDKVQSVPENGTISINFTDAKDILNMGAYLNSNKLFAAQMRMLLSSEKDTKEWNELAVYAPYKTPARTVLQKPTTLQASSLAGVLDMVGEVNTYYKESVFLDIVYKVYGNFSESELKTELGLTEISDDNTVGLSGWTNAHVKAYGKLETAKERAEYYFSTMIATYNARVAKHDAAYADYRAKMEEKAMKAIRGYIGGNGVLPANVDTVEKFIFGEELTITLDFGKGASVIEGMPLSVKLTVKRGSTNLFEVKAGVQFIDASKIPTDSFAADYWKDAVEVSTGYDKDGNFGYADVVVQLLKVHAHFAGFDNWTDVVGKTVA